MTVTPWYDILSRAEPSRAEPSRAEPSRAEPSRAEPSRAEPSRAEPSRAEPSRAEPSRAEPSRAEPSRAEPSRAEPSRAVGCTPSSTSRPDPRPGRRRARLLGLLPALALLLGVLSLLLLPAAPAQAQAGPPTNLAVTPGNGKLVVTWTRSTTQPAKYFVDYTSSQTVDLQDPTGFNPNTHATHWRSSTSTSITAATHTVQNLTNDTTYRVRVQAVPSVTSGLANSAWVEASGTPAALAAPSGIDVSRHPTSTTSLRVQWGRVTGATAYEAEWRLASDASAVGSDTNIDQGKGTSTNPFDITGLTSGTAYEVRVRAKNADGGTWSGWFGGTPGTAVNPTPVRNQNTIWSATLTVQQVTSSNIGCLNAVPNKRCSSTSILTDDDFTYGGVTYTIDPLWQTSAPDGLVLSLDKDIPAGFKASATLHVDGARLPLANADYDASDQSIISWSSPGLGWSVGDTISLSLSAPPQRAVSLSVSSSTVKEGHKGQVGTAAHVMATLDSPAPGVGYVSIPLTASSSAPEFVSTKGSWLIAPQRSIIIRGGETTGKVRFQAMPDDDADDATVTVALDTANLPAGVIAGATTSVDITITDDERTGETPTARPQVTLSASPNPVNEGQALTVTATLSEALSSEVTILVVAGVQTAEFSDVPNRRLEIVIPAGQTSGLGTIETRRDADTDDETFDVVLHPEELPLILAAGHPPSVAVTITDTGTNTNQLEVERVTVGVTASPNPVNEGDPVTVTATLSEAVSSDLTIPLTLTDVTAEPGDRGTLASLFIPAGGTSASGRITTNQDADSDDETFTVGLDGANLPSEVESLPRPITVTITDVDTELPSRSGKYTALIAKIREWRNDPRYKHDKNHTDRWDRVLLAFGETVSDGSLTAMSAAEAQGYADRGWTRWVEVAEALWEMEGGRPVPDPVVTVAAGGGVTEGAAAGFTLTAAPAPAADLAVTVAVSQRGAVADASALGERTVTIPGGTASADFTVATVDDEADEENGQVVAALSAGDGYTLGDPARATVTVADDDEDNPAISTRRAIARETDDAVVFTVRLDRRASHTVTVDYATADGPGVWAGTGTATAGVDYTATSGTLTFAAGETLKSVSVPILDDVIDEGSEYFLLRLSNPQGATLDDSEVEGLIRNTDLIPGALLGRFGRATAEQVVTQIEERMTAPRRRGFRARFAGRELRSGQERDFALGFLTQFAQPMGMGSHAGAASMGMGPAGGAPMGMGPHAAGAGAFGVSTGGMNGMGAGMGGMPGGAMGMTGMGAAASMGMNGMGAAGGAMGMGAVPGAMGGYGPAGGMHGGGLLGSMGMGGDLFSNSEFELNRESRGGMLSVWSRSSRSYFSGLENALSLDGDVRTTMFGADYSRGALTLGLSVGRTLGLGGYRRDASAGQMTTSMTGFYPWVGYQVNDRVSVWGVTGYGTGGLSLTPEGHAAMETGVSMAMTAVGTRGELIGARATGGFSLAFKADALWVGAASDLVDGAMGRLNASEAGVTRVRTALEGSRGYTLVGGRLSLTPSVEVGLRRDGGDAETGAGMDVGGGLAFTDAVTGLSLDVRMRTLVVHQAEGFAERGMSLSFGWDPTPSSPLGLTARVAPSWGGSAQGGAETLWNNQMAYPVGSHQMYGAGGQLNAEVGYGLPLGARLVGTPRVGLTTSQYGRDYRVGYALGAVDRGKLNFELGVDAQRREMTMQGEASNGVMGRGTLGW